MKIRNIKNAEDLVLYLRDFKAWESDDIYDFDFITYLLQALLDNLQEFGMEHEFNEIGYKFNDSQREFLTRLSKHANKITDEMIELEDSQTDD